MNLKNKNQRLDQRRAIDPQIALIIYLNLFYIIAEFPADSDI